ncbi:YlbF family regulator [Ruminiclostridium herbifermentans]|uniref:YlbF family regulator n=1 Tax=Ruminiclostridium herbifermentans TaxID=2488810 RepID=A0A4U7JMX4_9FIRM|nr:YlbF family regulator [Ruminiclostridium herbifermentans]QNU65291.1 YlbF family regulator [Ruminiclostridium herbifermentans]
MDITEKARELGLMMAESKEMKAYNSAEAAMKADEKSNKLMKEYKQLQIEMVKATRENAGAEAIDKAKIKLLEKQQEINDYEITNNYLVSKANLEALMKKVNDIIVYSITGESGCTDDKCKTCGGGCKG